jgi:hypothetical protein
MSTETTDTLPAPITPAEDVALHAAKDAAWDAWYTCPPEAENKAELRGLYAAAERALNLARHHRELAEYKADKARDAAARRLEKARAALAAAEAEAEAACAVFRALQNDRRELQRLIAIHNVAASKRRGAAQVAAEAAAK